ncbi:MAG: hypothetical protein JRD68_01565 [Deltaproteobacteria bacterium]|nr:hypothetical protein [Deltaproteobacteria bacterium]
MKQLTLLICIEFLFLIGCSPVLKQTNYPPGTFGYDLNFITSHRKVIVLKDESGKPCLITSPELQGRILTSSFDGPDGISLGYINHERIASTEIFPHTQGYGGEDRFWIGPQGGQYTIYFHPGDAFNFDNWFTPAPLDTELFEVVAANDSMVHYRKKMSLQNYVQATFDLEVNRKIRLIGRKEAQQLLSVKELDRMNYVGFESDNEITNTGTEAWEKESGLLSIWILGMFPGGSTVIIPYHEGQEAVLGPVYNEYFTDQLGMLDESQIKIENGTIFYKGSGNYNGKIGVGAKRARSFLGSYDEKNNILTIIHFSLPNESVDYVNSQWEQQEEPYAGDVVNAYNDGPLDREATATPTFYELESSSPAYELKPGGKMVHFHRTYHFQGSRKQLNNISQTLLGVNLKKNEGIFFE